jgi:signal transduction histidine kinase
MTPTDLRIVFVEDAPEDVELEERELRRSGLAFKSLRVDTKEDLIRALAEFKPQVIISDYSLPHLDGLTALRIVREHAAETPFIFVSGTIGEERAVNSLKEGATDYVLKDKLGRLVHAVSRAIRESEQQAERLRLEGQVRQAQKMEAIGRLAGGIAHDFNNLLTAILGYAEVALSGLEEEHPQRSSIQEVLNAGQRASSLTRQLLAFSRKQVLSPKVLSLNQIVADIEKMLRRIIGEDIQFVITLDPQLGNVKADPGQVEQVIMNVALNARDAMPQGGQLTIETRNVDLDESFVCQFPGARAGAHVMLSLGDTGRGMDAETLAHIFEPFFTTKEQGKGTGLGLSTVYGIVRQSEGLINVRSEPGRGATFEICLPRVHEARDTRKRVRVDSPAAKGSETILVVEDSDPVRELILGMLREKGYNVLAASDGDEALEMAEKHEGAIHLLVTDVVMPRLGGPELAQRLLKDRPGMSVLFMSGYTDKGIVFGSEIEPDRDFLQKPFTTGELARRVRGILDSTRPA